MAAMQGAISAAERSMRSVFVGNIPYEATEEQLKDIFSEVGPVVSFRLVYDRETGKPKGYGFCEYKDQEMALSAMRNLNGYELNGRALRVDNAASEKSKEELKNLQASLGGPPVESPYGPDIDQDKAPEAISKAVASLPPEQMFELMKQMKMCIQNNPNEARNLLLQNPQLAFALLQAQVIMKIVDPQVALSLLHRQNPNIGAGLLPTPDTDQNTQPPTSQQPPQLSSSANMNAPVMSSPMNPFPQQPAVANEMSPQITYASGIRGQPPVSQTQPTPAPGPRLGTPAVRPSLLGDRPAMMSNGPRPTGPAASQYPDRGRDNFEPYIDPRTLGDRDMRQPLGDRDMRQPLGLGDKDMRQPIGDQDLRHIAPARGPYDPRFRGAPNEPLRPPPPPPPPAQFDPRLGNRSGGFDQRNSFEARGTTTGPARIPEEPRTSQNQVAAPAGPPRQPPTTRISSTPVPPVVPPASSAPSASARQSAAALAQAASSVAPNDQEKAALILQVLQLSDQQIAMLPAEQRQSIMILKEQFARNAQQT